MIGAILVGVSALLTRLQDTTTEIRVRIAILLLEAFVAVAQQLTRWSAWRLEQPAADRVLAEHLLHPQPGYPFTVRCRADYRLGPDGLVVRMSVANQSDRPAPVGMGAHPYLSVGDAGVHVAALRVPAETRLLADHRGIPTGRAPVPDTEQDYRRLRRIGATVLDCAYTDLIRDADGLARVHLSIPDPVRPHRVGRPAVVPPAGVHRRHDAAGRAPAEHRGRTDDLCPERLQHRRRPAHPGPR